MNFANMSFEFETQYKAQRTLKENLKDGHATIHLDFAEELSL